MGDMQISAKSPHKIQSVSKIICANLDYTMKQLISRSINILFGPNTNAASLHSTLKRQHSFVDPDEGYCCPEELSNFSIYDSNGRVHLVLVVCHPEIKENKIAGFSLRFYSQSRATELDPPVVSGRQEVDNTKSSCCLLASRDCTPFSIPEPQHCGPTVETCGNDWRDELEIALMTLDAFSIVDRGCFRKLAGNLSAGRDEPRNIAGSLIITARAPHTVLGTSPELCSLLGFSSAEMTQRSVRLLYGPDTHPAAIPSAVKRLFSHEACTIASVPALTIHDRSGAPHVVRAECTRVPPPTGDGCGAEACRVRLEWPSSPAASRPPPALPACLWSLR